MADLITLQEALNHLRVDPGVDDDKVTRCIKAAIQKACNYCDRKFYANAQDMASAVTDGTAGEDPMVADDLVIAAILLLIGTFYAIREDVIVGPTVAAVKVPIGAEQLLYDYRTGLGV